MNLSDRFFAFLLYLTGVVFVAGIVHLIAILAMPHVAPRDAYARLAALAKPGQMTLLPRPLPGHEITPFEDAAAAQAVCLFDLSNGPLRLHADLAKDRLVTLSFRTRTGRIFYALTDSAAVHGSLDVRVLTGAQLEDVEENEDVENQPLQELRLVAPDLKGFVLVNALAAFPSQHSEAEAAVTSVSCSPETLARD